jgi:hypothetical protein
MQVFPHEGLAKLMCLTMEPTMTNDKRPGRFGRFARGSCLLGLLVLAICMPSKADEATNNYSDIGISSSDLTNFLSLLHHDVSQHNVSGICSLLGYPITVTLHQTNYLWSTPRDCSQNFDIVFTPDFLKFIRSIRLDRVSEAHSLLMVDDGELWISKFYVGNIPLRAAKQQLDVYNTEYWQMRIVNINWLVGRPEPQP